MISYETEDKIMKKRFTLIILGTMIAMILCSCSSDITYVDNGQNTDNAPAASAEQSKEDQSSKEQDSSSEQSGEQASEAAGASSEDSSEEESSEAESSAESQAESKAESSAESQAESKAESSAESQAESKAESSAESQAESKAESSAESQAESKAESSAESQAESSEEEIEPRKYLDPLKMSVDISDEKVAAENPDITGSEVYYITSTKELDDFYEKYKKTYSLDEVDSGLAFKAAVSSLGSDYFKENDVFIVVEKYEKGSEFTAGDLYKQDGVTVMDIYKDDPGSAESTAYILDITGALKTDLGGSAPKINILPSGGYITDKPDDEDEIVSEGE